MLLTPVGCKLERMCLNDSACQITWYDHVIRSISLVWIQCLIFSRPKNLKSIGLKRFCGPSSVSYMSVDAWLLLPLVEVLLYPSSQSSSSQLFACHVNLTSSVTIIVHCWQQNKTYYLLYLYYKYYCSFPCFTDIVNTCHSVLGGCSS